MLIFIQRWVIYAFRTGYFLQQVREYCVLSIEWRQGIRTGRNFDLLSSLEMQRCKSKGGKSSGKQKGTHGKPPHQVG